MDTPCPPCIQETCPDMAVLVCAWQYDGYTPLAGSMQTKVLEPIIFNQAASGQLAKPVLIITITDGEAMAVAGVQASSVALGMLATAWMVRNMFLLVSATPPGRI